MSSADGNPAQSPSAAETSRVVQSLFTSLHQESSGGKARKVTIVGAAGAVGLAVAYSIINQGLAGELALVDVMADKLKGEAADLMHGAAFSKRVVVKASSDYAVSADSDLVVITAGARQREGESRLELVGRNLEIFRGVVEPIVRYSPHCTICVVSNPVDIMTYVVSRLSGFPSGRVFGSGTALDSSRFRTIISDKLGVDARSVHGYILGEHGDSSVACWSSLNIGGVRLRDIQPTVGKPDGELTGVHRNVIDAAYEIIKAKGYTNWAIGLTVASIAESVLRNEHRVMPLSVPVKGRYGITEDVYLSLPAVLGRDGVVSILTMPLDAEEEQKLRGSAAQIGKVQAGLNF